MTVTVIIIGVASIAVAIILYVIRGKSKAVVISPQPKSPVDPGPEYDE